MIDRFQYQKAVEKASAMLRAAGLMITPAERERFEVLGLFRRVLDRVKTAGGR